jgi:hypothetical protein
MGKILSLTIAIALSPLAAAPARPYPVVDFACGSGSLFRKADLPPQAVAALHFAMADPDQPFQVSDDVPPGPRLPFRRLICASPIPGGYAVHYEYGGKGRGMSTTFLKRQADGSFIEERPRVR